MARGLRGRGCGRFVEGDLDAGPGGVLRVEGGSRSLGDTRTDRGWARRVRRDGWQFPQGGMNSDETPLEAMYRELEEEVGLRAEHVEVLGATPGWLRYRLPNRFVRRNARPTCVGQKGVPLRR